MFMSFEVYVDGEGYVCDVSAPDRASAVAFLVGQGFELGTFEIREMM